MILLDAWLHGSNLAHFALVATAMCGLLFLAHGLLRKPELLVRSRASQKRAWDLERSIRESAPRDHRPVRPPLALASGWKFYPTTGRAIHADRRVIEPIREGHYRLRTPDDERSVTLTASSIAEAIAAVEQLA